MDAIEIRRASAHNLQAVSLSLPRDRLIVMTGVSGSGKSSLAFDTIFAEGQRRYVESLSAYARQFLEQFEKPDVESIDGLSPAIAIDQKTASRSPRSTVGTVTEVYDYLRLLYARVGSVHCPTCQAPVSAQSPERIAEQVASWGDGARLQVLAPVVRGRKGDYNALFHQLRKEGFTRARIDGEAHLLEELPDDHRLARHKTHQIDVVMDRIVLKADETTRQRLLDAISAALRKSDGFVIVQRVGEAAREQFFASHLACPNGHALADEASGGALEEMAPRLFSFNSPYGACAACEGLGAHHEIAESALIPDPSKSLREGAIGPLERFSGRYYQAFLRMLAARHEIDLDTPYRKLSNRQKRFLLYGDGKNVAPEASSGDEASAWEEMLNAFDGVVPILKRRHRDGSDASRAYIEGFMRQTTCPACEGARLKPLALSVQLGGLNIFELSSLPLAQAWRFLCDLPASLSETQLIIGRQPIAEAEQRLRFLLDVGLSYLTLARPAATLSGGEAQRIRLATQLGANLSGILYILDEPSIGLHPHNNRQLIETLLRLRDQGNSVIVIEHDEETIRAADWVVDIGPGAGRLGGRIVAQGPPESLAQASESLTGDYLYGRAQIALPTARRTSTEAGALVVKNASLNNLKGIDAVFPLGKLILVTGLSGSGKSTLVFDLLRGALRHARDPQQPRPEGYDALLGVEAIDRVIEIDQAPIGRSPRSNPATYTGVFDEIRQVFAASEDAKIRGYKPGRFSFNVKGGRCEACQGAGHTTLEMNFLPDAQIHCDACDGRRYNAETLSIRYRGHSIADVLAMPIAQACQTFEDHPRIHRQLSVICEVGLEYMTLGQSATTLSGGEAQRLKLACEFVKRATGRTLYLMDEPSVGLHWRDLDKLIAILQRLVDQGNTVVVIEHNLDLVKVADHVIDMGPEGGDGGGFILAEGPPQVIAACPDSYTGQFLAPLLASPAAPSPPAKKGRGKVKR